jgi:hypothetical protein
MQVGPSLSLAAQRLSLKSRRLPEHSNGAKFVALNAISRNVRESVKDRLKYTTHNINLKLAKFFKDPKAFRSVQAQTGALISGDFAQAFFVDTTASVDKLLIRLGGAFSHRCFKAFLESDGWTQLDSRVTEDQ